MVEDDGTQRLWKYDFKEETYSIIAKNLKPVGYHAWLNETNFISFILGDPPGLYRYDTQENRQELIHKGIGRSLHKIPGRTEGSFVDRSGDVPSLRSYDGHFNQTTEICQLLPGSQDLAWIDGDHIVMANEEGLFIKNTNTSEDWYLLDDLKSVSGKKPSRIAIDPKGKFLAIVMEE
jgi:hypothetical protein